MPNPLSLKQRLAVLSNLPSSPASPYGQDPPRSPISLAAKRKIFTPPWKRQHEPALANGLREEYGESEAVQDVMAKMIFQAGVDFETRPMVVINASALPDPREVSYDLLLSRILGYLNLYVESDYTVVFFTAGGKHTPGWNWVWKAYRSLSRKYRKHLKQLYIVHSSFFSKMLFSLAGAIISPKFFRKITYVTTLSDLAHHVPLTQIDIAPAVYQENLKHEKKITLPVPTRSSIFGVPLDELMGYNGEKGGIPRVVKDCMQFLRERGMMEDGLFRRSPQSVMLRAAQDAYDRGHVVSLDTFGDPHLAAVLLKKYLRDLPEPIFPEHLYPLIRRCPSPASDPNDMSSISYIRETLLPELPPCVYILLSHVLHLMHEVSLRAASNRMDAYNLAVVLCPNLVRSPNPARDIMMCAVPGGPSFFEPHTRSVAPTSASSNNPNTNSKANNPDSSPQSTTLGAVIHICIERYYEVFDEVWDRSEALPLPASQSQSQSVSSSNSASPAMQYQTLNQAHNDNDSEDIDDAMLVMPLGPSHSKHNVNDSPPSAWGASTTANGGSTMKSRPGHRSKGSGGSGSGSGVRSVHTGFGDGNGGVNGNSTMRKARSMVSIENGVIGSVGTVGRKGSISVGRGGTRKASGAGVEALGVTVAGFFTPPSGAPPVPHLRTGEEK